MTDKLVEAYELLSDPARWTEGASARLWFGMPVSATNPFARSFCAMGALDRVGASGSDRFHLDTATQELYPEHGSVVWLNDCVGYEAVLAAFRRAIEIKREYERERERSRRFVSLLTTLEPEESKAPALVSV